MRVEHPMIAERVVIPVSFSFNGTTYIGRQGDTVGMALWAQGVKALRHSEKKKEPRGMYCGIGQCYECRVYHSEVGMVKACTTPISEGAEFFSKPNEREP